MSKIVRLDEKRKPRKGRRPASAQSSGAEIKPFDTLRALFRVPVDTAPSEYVAPDEDSA